MPKTFTTTDVRTGTRDTKNPAEQLFLIVAESAAEYGVYPYEFGEDGGVTYRRTDKTREEVAEEADVMLAARAKEAN